MVHGSYPFWKASKISKFPTVKIFRYTVTGQVVDSQWLYLVVGHLNNNKYIEVVCIGHNFLR